MTPIEKPLILFQPATSNSNSAKEGLTDSKLNDIKPLKAKVSAKIVNPAQLPMLDVAIATTKSSLTRIKAMVPSSFKELGDAIKSIGNATALGAFVGFCSGGGFTLAGVGGFFLGAFLGGLAHTAKNVVDLFKQELKNEVLDRAELQLSGEANDKISNGAKESTLDFTQTTLHYTQDKESLDLSKLGNSLKDAAPKIATIMLNAKNNASKHALEKLDLSKNGLALDEKFVAELIQLSSNEGALEVEDSEKKSHKTQHGLTDTTIDVRGTGVASGEKLASFLNALEVGNDLTISNPTQTENGKLVPIRFKQIDSAKEICITLVVDDAFETQEAPANNTKAATETQEAPANDTKAASDDATPAEPTPSALA